MATIKIHMQLTCTVREDKDTNCYVSHCPILNVFSAGNSELEAIEAIRSALKMYARALLKQNRLGEKLQTVGFTLVSDGDALPKAEQFIAVEVGRDQLQTVEVDVPLLLTMNAQVGELMHA